MAILGRGKGKEESQNRVLDVTASMQGSLIFREPVSLRISGRFEGTLETQGELTIGEAAQVRAEITGESITVAGRVEGKIIAKRSLKLVSPAVVRGDVWTPLLEVEAGASLDGSLHMGAQASTLSTKDLAEYLEVDVRTVEQWAKDGKIPGSQEGGQWRFEKSRVDEWVATQKSS
ncbi:MAG: polymer-forming cytoskeletal protein [Candidatus Omnitrophota bacterium]|nr:polymer-forming cytoskeletal protein [Candidatus Omnitrophota bacterium]